VRRRFFLWALLLALCPLRALAQGIASTVAAPIGPEETLLAVSINGDEVSSGAVLLREGDGTYALDLEDAQAWRLVLPVRAQQTYQGQIFVALRALAGIKVSYNEILQRLELVIAPRYFAMTAVDPSTEAPASAAIARGMFLNYDFLGQNYSNQPGVLTDTILNPGVSIGRGVLNADFLGQTGNDGDVGPGLRRLATTWQQDNPAKHTSLLIGDAANVADTLVPEEPFVGAQFGSNFAAGAGITMNPRPSVAGSADSPSNADVYVDGRLVLQQALPTGPFQIQNIPVMGDLGNVQVIVKNSAGGQKVLTTSYYSAPTLLKRGLSQYALGAGFLETQSQTGAPLYGIPIAQAYEQHGFTNRFTGEVDAQAAQGGGSASGGGIWSVPHLGIFDAALAAGGGIGEGGSRFDYEYKSRGLDFGAGVDSIQQISPIVISPGLQQAPLAITRTSDMFLSTPLGKRGSLSFTVLNENAGPEDSTRTLSLDYSAGFGRSQLDLDFFKTSGSIVTNAVTMQLTIPIGDRRRFIAAASTGAGTSSADGTYQSDPVLDGEHHQTGYSVTAGTDFAAELDYIGKAADIDAGFSSLGGFTDSELEIVGSVANVDHHLLAARGIAAAYGIAEVPGYRNVRVYVNGQFAGVTDARGYLLLPDLLPYQENVVSLEGKDLPVSANFESLSETVVPYFNSPAIVRFKVRGNGGILVHMKTADGAYLPAGATLSANGVSWPVADLGEAYLEGVKPGPLVLSASAGTIHCRATLVVPANVSRIPDVGTIPCL